MTGTDTALTLERLPLAPLVTVGPDATLRDCIDVLVRHDAELVGIAARPFVVIDRDVVLRVLATGAQPDDAALPFAVAPAFVSCHEPAIDAVRDMARDGRARVVIDGDGGLVGVLTLALAAGALVTGPQWLGALRVALHIEATR